MRRRKKPATYARDRIKDAVPPTAFREPPIMSIPTFTLNNGAKIPAIGLGCFLGEPGGGDQIREMVETALKLGYRHLDSAAYYATEEDVGKAIRSSGIPREEIFVTTKLNGTDHARVEAAVDESLRRLDIGYIDLFLVHSPQGFDETGRPFQPEESPTIVETWKAMEKLIGTGKVKSIGVSNFTVKLLDILLAEAAIVPAVNQIELHPLYPQFAEQEYCKSKGITITAYSPFAIGQKDLIEHPTLKEIGSRTGHSPTQVIMGWLLKKGVAAIPKSATHQRMVQNIQFADFSADEEAKIDAIHKVPGFHRTSWGKWCVDGKWAGWTYEQLGVALTDGGHVKA
ncbi:hypothetical protein EIP91_012332 [Steccherinum ochraceum]|uniref:NADP-dependent oxidoreductase domain-containing protein n=1 Tax=Steccherinum ochraceum TaxID=92696 RepID=A0A4R0RGS5_9APHY|nr:hypothetical protein EIP91_012332 [Steccherinum ochraceum]